MFSSSAACQAAQSTSSPNAASQIQDPQQPATTTLQTSRPADTQQVYIDSAGTSNLQSRTARDLNLNVFPPDPLTDLQKLALSSTGELVPVFGRELFQRAPSTFAPADQIPVTPDYVVGPGDEVLVRIYGEQASNNHLTVDTAGNIYIPGVGSVQVAGLRYNELEKRISAEVNHIFRNYRISVSLGHLRSIQVYVVGEARRPGAYTISSLSTVLNALFESGGPNVQGSMRHIQVRRAGTVLPEFDLYDLVLRGDKSKDVRLESGDTIFIPSVGSQAVIAGSVNHPAVYELAHGTTLDALLSLSGGFSATAVTTQVTLERIEPDHARQAMSVNLDVAGRGMQLRDGDVLYANHISAGYEQSVTIRGNLANPGRFAWHTGMRLSDIIPDRSSLLTNDYWAARNRLGVPVPLFTPTPTPDFRYGAYPRSGPRSTAQTSTAPGGAARQEYAGPGLSQAAPLNLPPTGSDVLGQADAAAGTLFSQSPDDPALGAGALQYGAGQYGVGQYGLGQPYNGSVQSNATLPDGTPANPLQQPFAYSQQPLPQGRQQQTSAPINRISIPAPEIDWSYAAIERLDPNTLKSSLVPFNLGKLVQDHDPSQNLELQPGDIVTILSQRDIPVPLDEQTKYIRLEGEFASAGVYSVGPNETLDQVVQRAGGFTRKAYLYGSKFLRESARVFQQQRLDEYISELSADMERATAVRAASSASGVLDPNSLGEQRFLIAQLRQMRATGRVVLEFQPDSMGVTSVPPIPLEDGDVFSVPARPITVSVIGAVYGQNVFLYDPRRRLDDYLALAGKTNRIADKDHAFIIRADGSIYSRERAQRVFSNVFDSTRLNPGDAIVVPEKLIKPTALRQLIDYSQILSSFGLAAAAINVIR